MTGENSNYLTTEKINTVPLMSVHNAACFYHNKEGRSWKLSFQTEPTHDIILIGDIPTRDEIVAVLETTHMPCILIPIIECIVASGSYRDNS